jgi:hypothetical protein
VRKRLKVRVLALALRQKSEMKSAQHIENKEQALKRVRERVRTTLKIKSMRENDCLKECAMN